MKSSASELLCGYFYTKSAFSMCENVSRYSRAFWSVTKDLSDSDGVPITAKITESWSWLLKGKPCLCSVGFFDGESGKQLFPGNRG